MNGYRAKTTYKQYHASRGDLGAFQNTNHKGNEEDYDILTRLRPLLVPTHLEGTTGDGSDGGDSSQAIL